MLGLVSDQADRASPVTVGLLLEPRSHCAVILKEYRTHATLAMSHGMTLACTRGRGTSVSTTRRSSSAAGTGIRSIALEAEMVISMPSLRRAVRVVDAPEPDSHVGRTRATDADGDVTLAERTADREELQLAPSTGLSMRVAVGFAVYATHEAGTSELTSAHTASHGRSFAPMGAGSRGDRSAAVVTVATVEGEPDGADDGAADGTVTGTRQRAPSQTRRGGVATVWPFDAGKHVSAAVGRAATRHRPPTHRTKPLPERATAPATVHRRAVLISVLEDETSVERAGEATSTSPPSSVAVTSTPNNTDRAGGVFIRAP